MVKVLSDCILALLLGDFNFGYRVFSGDFCFCSFCFFLVVFLIADLVSAVMKLGIM